MNQIQVLKLDLSGAVVWKYAGTVIRRRPHRVTLEAPFDIDRVPVADAVLRRGDRFVETYYDRRMYNVFRVFDGAQGPLKGWYCNISRPAILQAATVAWIDLALDLWIGPEGRQFVLDRDEFDGLQISPEERFQALTTLTGLQRSFRRLVPEAPR